MDNRCVGGGPRRLPDPPLRGLGPRKECSTDGLGAPHCPPPEIVWRGGPTTPLRRRGRTTVARRLDDRGANHVTGAKTPSAVPLRAAPGGFPSEGDSLRPENEMRFQINRSHDRHGASLYINGKLALDLNGWKLWRYQQRSVFGFLFTATLPARVGRGSAAWRSLPWWRRLTTPPSWMTRTLYFGWRTRGGKGPAHGPWPRLRAGFAFFNDVPYSFR